MSKEIKGGLLLMLAIAAAVAVANSPWSDWYFEFIETPISFSFGDFRIDSPFKVWVDDGLMTFFFFLVGLEIKSEVVGGQLRTFKNAALPMAGALGGMILPAAIYLLITNGQDYAHGWAIPMATDIAFSLVVLSFFKNRIDAALIIFLTALAIVDDLGSILVIAFFYSADTDYSSLLVALGFFLVLLAANRAGVRHPYFYLVVGVVGLWYFFLTSGIHATLSGVIIALAIPSRTKIDHTAFAAQAKKLLEKYIAAEQSDSDLLSEEENDIMAEAQMQIYNAETPLQRWRRVLEPFVNYGILPLFAFVNAGVLIDGASLSGLASAVSVAIVLALVVGKPLGISLAVLVFKKANISCLLNKVSWLEIIGVSCLAGIGFTMSIFIVDLAFERESLINTSKLAIIAGSVMAAGLGSLLLLRVPGGRSADLTPEGNS